jgi:Zn-dependent protease with chaperone function
VARRAKRQRKREPKAQLQMGDYQYPGERAGYWQGVCVLAGAFLVATVVVSLYVFGKGAAHMSSKIHGQWWVPLEILGYPVLSILVVNWLAVRPRRQQFKETGMQSKVLSKTYPQLKQMLTEQSKMLGMSEPDMYLVDDDMAYMYSMPGKGGTIVASKPLLGALKPEELAAMVGREMGHIKSHHVRMGLAINYIRRANLLWKILLFPVTLFSVMLRGWVDLTEYTADRVAFLVTGRAPVVNAALVKSAVAADKQSEVDSEELEAYLEGGADISTDSEQMERHFKIGQFLSSQKGLRERIEQMGDFARTTQGQAALAKMEEVRSRL